jgi:NAD(P)-dependent dehydrogenase (short-subunit alcohol dehydrogenase family)
MQIKDRTFIVTGGASGLGAGVAQMIVAAGGNVMLADMNAEKGADFAKKLGQAARFSRCDVTFALRCDAGK